MYSIAGFSGGLDAKESACSAGGPSSIPGSGRSPGGGGHGNPLQCSCLENSTERGAWQSVVHRVAQSQIQLKGLSMHAHGFIFYTPLLMNINFFFQIFVSINYAAAF